MAAGSSVTSFVSAGRLFPAPPEAPSGTLEALPEDVLRRIASWLLIVDPPGILRLRRVCTYYRDVLSDESRTVLARSLAWRGNVGRRNVAARLLHMKKLGFESGWATGSPLPSTGRCSFSVRITGMCTQRLFKMFPIIGVSPLELNYKGWGLTLPTGRIERWTQDDAKGTNRFGNMAAGNAPHGWPDYDGRLLLGEDERLPHLPLRNSDKNPVDVEVEVIVDADAGSVSFRVNGGRLLQAIEGFPRGTQLRPWALVNCAPHTLTLSMTWHEVGEVA